MIDATETPLVPEESDGHLVIHIDLPGEELRGAARGIVERGAPTPISADELAKTLTHFVKATSFAVEKAAKASERLSDLSLAEVKVYAAFEASGKLRLAGAGVGVRGEAGFEILFRVR